MFPYLFHPKCSSWLDLEQLAVGFCSNHPNIFHGVDIAIYDRTFHTVNSNDFPRSTFKRHRKSRIQPNRKIFAAKFSKKHGNSFYERKKNDFRCTLIKIASVNRSHALVSFRVVDFCANEFPV